MTSTAGVTVGVSVRVSSGIEIVGIGVGVEVAVGVGVVVGDGVIVEVGDAVNVGVGGTGVIGSACATGAAQPHSSPNTIHP